MAAPAPAAGSSAEGALRNETSISTYTATPKQSLSADHKEEDQGSFDRTRKIAQAVDEGHDADIPTAIGYVLDDKGELKRQKSIADQREIYLQKQQSNGAADVEKNAAAGQTNESPSHDPNIVWWDGPSDPENPLNWPAWRTNINCGLISLLTFVTPLASSIFAPGVPELMVEFETSNTELAAFVVSVYVLGFAFGPLVIAPMSEIYGRMPIYHACNAGFIAFTVACALAPSLGALIAFRFLAGIFGSCPLTNGGGSIADMIPKEKRGAVMAIFSIGPLLGPIIGPVAGGFLSAAEGWRWVFWLLAIVAGVLAIAMVITLRETYIPIILQRKTIRLRKETGNDLLRSKLDIGLSPADFWKRSIIRPLKLLAFSPIVIVLSIYLSIVYGYIYLMFTSVTTVFEETYGFSRSIVGLVYLGLGIGSMLGLLYFSMTNDRLIKKMIFEGKEVKPESRLGPLPLGAIMMPAGFFIYGWTAEYKVHWIVPILGMAVIGMGNLIIFMALQLYLVDTFAIYAASALAANTVVRSVAGAVLPLFGLRMYAVLGLGWGNSLLGLIAVAMIPIPFLIIKYGEWLRVKFEVKNL